MIPGFQFRRDSDRESVATGNTHPVESAGSCRKKNHCRYCGTRLGLLRRMSRADFCSAEHEERAREIRRSQIARRLDEASLGQPKRHASYIEPAFNPAQPRATLAQRTGSLLCRPGARMLPYLTVADIPARRMAAPLGPEEFLVPKDLQEASPAANRLAPHQAPHWEGNGCLRYGSLPEIISGDFHSSVKSRF